ncbi:putative metallopeptidase [Bradyrhizobium pachyrhizi]|uniref:putative metallopeptidase n=1 Tax=Bradyrhizobium pachyrhizi TaxID=280333 RepID=UPI003D36A4CD
MTRPRAPAHLLDVISDGPAFVPAPDVERWIFETFIDEGSTLENPEHAHLQGARIGVLWTSVPNGKHGRAIVGQAQLCGAGGSDKWAKGKLEQQLTEWFGAIPDFLVTLFAPYADQANDATFCALVEHELSHCGQEKDEFGVPKFTRNGPSYCMRGHDVEEFIGVVRRYGADAAGVRAMIDAAAEGPTIPGADVSFACGNCLRG